MSSVRVAGHVHSDWSYDGTFAGLERIAAEFGRRGYGAVLVAEHDRTFDAERLGRASRGVRAASCARGRCSCPGSSTATPRTPSRARLGASRFLGAGSPTTS